MVSNLKNKIMQICPTLTCVLKDIILIGLRRIQTNTKMFYFN